jgi:1-acyl-sn-glycerol-3-phosphate acyltransferase
MALFYRISQVCLKGVFHLLYDHKVIKPEGIIFPEGAIIAANHLSFLDPPIVGASWAEDIFFLAKSPLFKNPFLKMLITQLNAHPVGGGHELASLKLACKLLGEGKKILLFPEGTRSNDGEIGTFKRGIGMLAMKAKCAIIPTYLHGTYDVWPKGQKLPSLFGKKTACIFGKPILPQEFPTEDTKESHDYIARRIQQEIVDLKNSYLEVCIK